MTVGANLASIGGAAWVSIGPPERRIQALRFECSEAGCHNAIEVPGKPGVASSPDHLARVARGKGWQVSPDKAGRNVCLACRMKRQQDAAKAVWAAQATKAKGMDMAVKEPIGAAVTPIAQPTVDQRVMIRGLLDKHFDDGVGMYLDGQTDQTIAELAKVPRVIVERMREAAYGPIKVTAEALAFQADVTALRGEITAAVTLLDGLKAKVAELEGRAGVVAPKRASA